MSITSITDDAPVRNSKRDNSRMKLRIHRTQHLDHFTIAPNELIRSLPPMALGVWFKLYSNADGWCETPETMAAKEGVSVREMRRTWRWLEDEARLIKRDRVTHGRGQFEWILNIYDSPYVTKESQVSSSQNCADDLTRGNMVFPQVDSYTQFSPDDNCGDIKKNHVSEEPNTEEPKDQDQDPIYTTNEIVTTSVSRSRYRDTCMRVLDYATMKCCGKTAQRSAESWNGTRYHFCNEHFETDYLIDEQLTPVG